MHDIADRLAADIERAAADAPDAPADLDALLASGRRSLARRRLAVGAGTAAAALVVGGIAWALVPGAGTATEPPIGTSPEAADGVTHYDLESGELVVADGWRVARRVDDPITGPVLTDDFPATEVDDSVGLVLESGSRSVWVMAWWSDDAKGAGNPEIAGTTEDPAGTGFDSFDAWLTYQTELQATGPDPVSWGPEAAYLKPDGTLVTKPGWDVVERRRGATTGGALALDMAKGEEHQYFLWSADGSGELWEPDGAPQTFDEWLDDVADGLAANRTPDEGER